MGSDIEPNDWFGMSLAIEGDVVLIGSPRKDGNTGAVYVFRLEETGAWTEQAKLTGAGTAVNSRFGSSVALRAGRAIIGAATISRVWEGPSCTPSMMTQRSGSRDRR